MSIFRKKNYAFGIDIGGTNTSIALVDKLTIKKSTEFETPEDLVSLKANIAAEIEKIRTELKISANLPVGIGLPGCVDSAKNKVIFSPNLQYLNGLKGSDIVKNAILINDADSSLLGEIVLDNIESDTFLITLGTGIGSSYFLIGKGSWQAVSSPEIGHIKVGGDRKCSCGQNGCLECYFSGRILVDKARDKIGLGSVDELFSAAKNGNEEALKIIKEGIGYLGLAIANMMTVMGIDNIILSGKISKSFDLFGDMLSEIVTKEAYFGSRENRKIQIRQSRHIDAAALIGAANFALRR